MIEKALHQYLEKNGYPSLNLKAVLFDMDGVLYNSMPFHARAWMETAEELGLKASPEDFYLYEGRTGEGTINELFQRSYGRNATKEEVEAIYPKKAKRFNAYNDGTVMKGASQLLQKVKSAGLQSVLVTGSGQYSLFEKLSNDFPGYFERDKMTTAYDVVIGKPHPEPYLRGLEKAGVKANEAIVIENAPMGVESAVAAGIFTVAVNTGPLADTVLLDAGANILYPDMISFANDWDNLLSLIYSL